MLFTQAYAQTATPPASPLGGGLDMILLFVPLILIMYLFVIRPQRTQMKKREEILKNIRRGDQIVTGGLVAKVLKIVDDNEIEAEIADGIKVRVVRSSITEVRAKTELLKEQAANKA